MNEDEANALIRRAYEVHEAANVAAGTPLLDALGTVTEVTKTYVFKHRLKSSAAIEGKVRRKRSDGERDLAALDLVPKSRRDSDWSGRREQAVRDSSYSADHVTDVLGCRFVTLYQSEIPRVVEGLLVAVEKFNEQHGEGPVYAVEFVVYTNRPAQDPISIVGETQRIVKRSEMFKDVAAEIREPESRKSAYSSVHFVFALEVEVQHAGRAKIPERVSFEVQIRDIFEEGWGEVQHDLLYSEKDRSDAAPDETASDRTSWALHLNALKTFVDGCSQHASIIKSNLDRFRANQAPRTATQSVSERAADVKAILQVLRRYGAAPRPLELVSEGYTLLISADDLADEVERLRRYAQAAASLDEAIVQLSSKQRAAKVREPLTVGYYLQMEAASARVSAATMAEEEARPSMIVEAEAIYARLETEFGSDPTVKMRLGKLVQGRASSAEDYTRSETLFDQSIALIADDPTTGDDHWIAISARIDKGVSIWKNSRLDGTVGSLLAGLAAAAEATSAAIAKWRAQTPSVSELNQVIGHKAASNITYYLSVIVEKGGTLLPAQRILLEDMVRQVEGFSGEPYANWYKTRDNLIHAYGVLGRVAEMAGVAKANFWELRRMAEKKADRPLDADEVRNHLTGSALTCFETAAAALGPRGSAGQADGDV